MLALYLAMNDMDAFYDGSKAFSKFWKDRGGADVKLKLRTVHKIIPHVRDTDTLQDPCWTLSDEP